jgi:drug/metabolite transporter (DMT)-like permease
VIYTRLRLREENVLVLTAGQVFASLALLVPVALVVEGVPTLDYSWQAWGAMAAAAFGGPVAGFAVVFYLIHRYSASLAGMAGIATPLFSALIGVAFLNEVVTAPILAGMMLVLLGVWSLNYF